MIVSTCSLSPRREFFQCDFDVAGTYSTMVADAEVIKVLVEILQVREIEEGRV